MRQFRSKDAFAACVARGMTMVAAARACGITRQAAYLWLKNDPEFREKIADAREQWCDVAETKLFELVRQGFFPAIAYALKHWKPETYDPRVRLALGGDDDAPPIATAEGAWIYPREEMQRPAMIETDEPATDVNEEEAA
jgi:hypothetical protein